MILTFTVELRPPKFTKVTEDVFVQRGTDVHLECSAEGSPKPKLMWLDGPMILTQAAFTPTGSIILTLNNVRYFNIFTCVAASIAGEIRHKVQVTVTGKLNHV